VIHHYLRDVQRLKAATIRNSDLVHTTAAALSMQQSTMALVAIRSIYRRLSVDSEILYTAGRRPLDCAFGDCLVLHVTTIAPFNAFCRIIAEL